MRHLITGGAGFIGSALAQRLLAAGEVVTILDTRLYDGEQEHTPDRLKLALGDVRDRALVNTLVAEADRVWHLASNVGVRHYIDRPRDTVSITLAGAEVIIDACVKHGRTLLMASTSEAYGKPEKLPMAEHDDIRFGPTDTARWVYGMAKALAEQLALDAYRRHGLDVRIFRPFNIVGPGQDPNSGLIFPSYARAIAQRDALVVHGDGRQTRTFCDVQDLVTGLQRLAQAEDAAGEVINIGSPVETSIIAVAESFAYEAARLGVPVPVRIVPYEHDYPHGFEDTRRRVPDLTRAEMLLGWHPPSLRPLHSIVRRTVIDAIGYDPRPVAAD